MANPLLRLVFWQQLSPGHKQQGLAPGSVDLLPQGRPGSGPGRRQRRCLHFMHQQILGQKREGHPHQREGQTLIFV